MGWFSRIAENERMVFYKRNALQSDLNRAVNQFEEGNGFAEYRFNHRSCRVSRFGLRPGRRDDRMRQGRVRHAVAAGAGTSQVSTDGRQHGPRRARNDSAQIDLGIVRDQSHTGRRLQRGCRHRRTCRRRRRYRLLRHHQPGHQEVGVDTRIDDFARWGKHGIVRSSKMSRSLESVGNPDKNGGER